MSVSTRAKIRRRCGEKRQSYVGSSTGYSTPDPFCELNSRLIAGVIAQTCELGLENSAQTGYGGREWALLCRGKNCFADSRGVPLPSEAFVGRIFRFHSDNWLIRCFSTGVQLYQCKRELGTVWNRPCRSQIRVHFAPDSKNSW